MVTNRQRCLLIGYNLLNQHKELRRQLKEQSKGAANKRTKNFKCAHCGKIITPTDENWTKCSIKKCNKKHCNDPTCISILKLHEALCQKPSPNKKKKICFKEFDEITREKEI